MTFVQEQHDTQVAETFVAESRARDQLEALHLAEMCLRAKHVDVEEFGDIVVSCVRVFFSERRSYRGRFLLDESPFVGNSLG